MKHFIRRCMLHWAVSFIQDADDAEVNEIIEAVTLRYQNKFPDWKVYFFSLPKEPSQRKEQLDLMIAFLGNHPEM